MQIRAALLEEQEMLEALQWRASLANPGDREALLAHPNAISLPTHQIEAGLVILAEDEGGCIGFAALLRRGDGDAELDGLFVEPDRWAQGIGRELVRECCALSRRMGAAYLHVIGNPHARIFYEKTDFQTVGLAETRFGVGILMRKKV